MCPIGWAERNICHGARVTWPHCYSSIRTDVCAVKAHGFHGEMEAVIVTTDGISFSELSENSYRVFSTCAWMMIYDGVMMP